MLVLSGVFDTLILVATNYANQGYMRVNYTLIVAYTTPLVTCSQSENADWSILVHCHLLVKHFSLK
jgi:hypothetical protein